MMIHTYIHTYRPRLLQLLKDAVPLSPKDVARYLHTYPPTYIPTYIHTACSRPQGGREHKLDSLTSIRQHTYLHTYLPTYIQRVRALKAAEKALQQVFTEAEQYKLDILQKQAKHQAEYEERR